MVVISLYVSIEIRLCLVVFQIRLREKSFRLELEPLNVLLRNTLEQLQAKDRSNIFAFPVPLKEVSAKHLNQLRPSFLRKNLVLRNIFPECVISTAWLHAYTCFHLLKYLCNYLT